MKHKSLIQTLVLGGFLLIVTTACWLHSPIDFSDSERRALAQFPPVTTDSLTDGSFMTDFEDYTLDQFPLRDAWRTIKAYAVSSLFGQTDNNDIYIENDVAVKMEYPMNTDSLDYACGKFQSIYDRYLKDSGCTVYSAIIPDKNAFLGKGSGHLTMDYEAFYQHMHSGMPYATPIDIAPLLDASDYYATDTHWRQERLIDVAEKLASAMGTTLPADYESHTLDKPFYGVYHGQAALPLPADTLYYLTNDNINGCTVFDHQNDKASAMYDMEKADGKDPYEIFLSGPISLITIDNPHPTSDKELVVFRDSFTSSIAPLLAQGYAKVTLIDIRYLPSATLHNYVDFDNQDVLFLYSTLVLNNSNTLK